MRPASPAAGAIGYHIPGRDARLRGLGQGKVSALVNIYWFAFAAGLGYLVVSAALGALGMSGHGHSGDHAGHAGETSGDGDVDAAAGDGFDAHADAHIDAHADSADGHDATQDHGHMVATEGTGADFSTYRLLSPASIASFLAGFGGAGLTAVSVKLPLMVSLAAALGGGVVMCALAYVVIGRWLMSMQSTSYARQTDMLGIEAEVLTPLEAGSTGEIAYILDGTRFTAPARLLSGDERIEKRDKVRISKVQGNIVYVVPRRKLLE